jgi:hypothetical protein
VEAQKIKIDALELNTWEVYSDVQSVTISYKIVDCSYNQGFDQQLVLLRYMNNSAAKVVLDFNTELYYNDVCRTCNMDEYRFSVVLNPNETVEGACVHGQGGELQFFSKSIDERVQLSEKLTDFEFTNFNLTSYE